MDVLGPVTGADSATNRIIYFFTWADFVAPFGSVYHRVTAEKKAAPRGSGAASQTAAALGDFEQWLPSQYYVVPASPIFSFNH